MKANELRIGNLITARYQDDYAVNQVVVNSVSEIGVNRCYGETEFYIENCEPIPLTEEWLVRFGFKLGVKGHFKTHGNNYKFNLYMYNVNLYKHVHQLQNLYFALTGEELEIK